MIRTFIEHSYFYRTRVRSLGMLVSNWLTNWLTHSLTNWPGNQGRLRKHPLIADTFYRWHCRSCQLLHIIYVSLYLTSSLSPIFSICTSITDFFCHPVNFALSPSVLPAARSSPGGLLILDIIIEHHYKQPLVRQSVFFLVVSSNMNPSHLGRAIRRGYRDGALRLRPTQS